MPEGPSIVILKEAVQSFKGKKIISVGGNTKIGKEKFLNQKVIDFKSWGKHFLICLPHFTIKIHFLLFGSYRINEERDLPTRLSLQFANGKINFYSCSIKIIEEDLNSIYDWSTDVMNEQWDKAKARKKLKAQSELFVCDALLSQEIFAGVGNIIKNEVQFRIRVNPLSKTGKLPAKKLTEMITEACHYCFQFYEWKKKYELKKHWLVHTKTICPRCNIRLVKQHLGKTNRRTFYCSNCQKLYE